MIHIRKPTDFGLAIKGLIELTRERSAVATMWRLGLLVLIPAGAYALFMLFTVGHQAFNTSSDGVNWGMAISTYVSLVLTSTGLIFIASLPMVFGFKEFYPIAKRCVWLAFVTLVAGFSVLALEIGHPFRMLWALPAGMQVMSPMFWMGVWYSICLVLLLFKFNQINLGDWHSGLSRLLGIASFIAEITALSTLGAVFGMMAMRPVWFDGLLPFNFLAIAAVSGSAFAMLFTHMTYGFSRKKMPAPVLKLVAHGLPNALATALAFVMIMVAARYGTGLWSNLDGLDAFHEQVKTPLFWVEIVVGLVLPFLLLLTPGVRSSHTVQVFASLSAIAGLFIGRYEFVVGGQRAPMFKGQWTNSLVPYTPSPTEWALFLIGCSLTVVLYAIGDKLFQLSATPPELEPVENAKVIPEAA